MEGGALVYTMHLSIDPLFCIALSPNAPHFHNFTPNDPLYFCYFDQNFLAKSSNFEIFCKSQQKSFLKMLTLSRFCAISHPMTPFLDLSSNSPLFARKLSLIAFWFDMSVLRDLTPVVPVRAISWRSVTVGFWDLWIDVIVQTKNRKNRCKIRNILLLYSDCLRRESNFLASTRRVFALCVRVCCIVCLCNCVMIIRKPMRK